MKGERDETESVDEVIGRMGRERVALRAKRTTIVLLSASSLVCLFSALASLLGYIPYAVGPPVVLMVTAVVGFSLAVIEARRT